jgi:hypothetical protein
MTTPGGGSHRGFAAPAALSVTRGWSRGRAPVLGSPSRPVGLSSSFLARSLSNIHHIGVQSPQAGEG